MDEWNVQELSAEQLTSLLMTLELETLSFEQAMELLEVVVARMEGGSLSLMQSLALQEFGSRLGAYCDKLLNEKETQLEVIKSDVERVALSEDGEA